MSFTSAHTLSRPSLVIRNTRIEPPLLCAPLAGFTHSAFRRVVATEFPGCGAFYTEMLSGRAILRENLNSPWLKRSPAERVLIYQLLLAETDPINEIVDRLRPLQPDGLDLNLGCHAPEIRKLRLGTQLFQNTQALAAVLRQLRAAWDGLLSVKIRLGPHSPQWQQHLLERLRIFEDCGVDMLVVHLRFFEDKFKRRARYEVLPWLRSVTSLPIIANGDIRNSNSLRSYPDLFQAQGWMIGRMAIAQPWVFAAWSRPVTVDYVNVWLRVFEAICEDFRPEQAIGRIKAFTHYYARNFRFGHSLATAMQQAATLEQIKKAALHFLEKGPELDPAPHLGGL